MNLFPFSFWKSAAGPPSPVPDILWWKMSDGSGTAVTADVGPNGVTDAAWVTGASGSGSALDFNGSSQTANSTSAVTYGVNVITVTGWYFLDDIVNTQIIFDSTGGGIQTAGYAIFIASGSNELAVQLFGSVGTQRQERSTVPSPGSWVNIAFVMDQAANANAGEIKIYYDGVIQATSTTVDAKAAAPNFGAYQLNVAAFGLASFFYNGRLDDLRIYGRELTGAEILEVVADPQ